MGHKTYLEHRAPYNPYFLIGENKSVEKITIYEPTIEGRLWETSRSWITLDGRSNNDGNDVLESLQFERTTERGVGKRLQTEQPFYHGQHIYIPTTSLPGFKDLGECKAFRTGECVYYGEYIEFEFSPVKLRARMADYAFSKRGELGAKEYQESLQRVEESYGVKPRKIMIGRYTRSEMTPRGKALQQLADVMTDKTCMNQYDAVSAAKLLLDDDEFVQLVNELREKA